MSKKHSTITRPGLEPGPLDRMSYLLTITLPVVSKATETAHFCTTYVNMIYFLLQELALLDTSSEDSNRTEENQIHDGSTAVITPSGTFNDEELGTSLRRTSSARRTSESSDVSLERSKSSPSRTKPPVPKRPASVKKKPQGSVDALLESEPTEDSISPLRPVSLSLLQDTMASLPVDAQEFLFSDTDINSLPFNTGGQSNMKTNLNSENNGKESGLQEHLTAQNHIGAVNLSRLEIRRASGPYDNVPKNNQALLTRNLDINSVESNCENPSKNCNSQQSWVSFE